MDNPGGDNNEPQDNGSGPSSGQDRAGGGGGGGGGGANPGGGSGGHGVGVSTGGWKAGCVFTDRYIITTNTRQWYCPIYNGHKYTKMTSDDAGQNGFTMWEGIATPWGHFNFNAYTSHFSPQDWQRLTNEYKKWRPVKMRVKIYNLQIKQIVNLGMDTLYNNDLTAGVHIFCDGSHQFPYSQHPWDEGTMPELPNEIWRLTQYAYYQDNRDLVDQSQDQVTPLDVEKLLRVNTPLFILESASHQVLRTGEETSFDFDFNSGWVFNDRAYAPPQADYNPLIATRRHYATWNSQTKEYAYNRYSPYAKPSQWVPGPSLQYKGDTRTSAEPARERGPLTVTYGPPGTHRQDEDNQEGQFMPSEDPTKPQSVQRIGYSIAPINGACSGLDPHTLAYDSSPHSRDDRFMTVRNIDLDMTRYNALEVFDGSTINGGRARLKNMWMYPNQAWNSTPISRANPIWIKTPRTDNHTLLDTSDGTIPMEHPPGIIFIKVAKIPIPTDNNADSYLNLYVTGQVTCEILWECERYQTKNWRPEIRNTAQVFKEGGLFDFNKQGEYNTPDHFYESMPTRIGINRVL
ncbi:capsid protein VP2 [Bat bocavirus WM40]|nr:capsid protein VP2 [Bat bocavirus WM40]AGL09960.1 capsid protein VP2 [Bat bocavirus WM40]